MASTIKRFVPLLDRVLVQKLRPELQTKSGLFLPDSAAKTSAIQATVMRVGPGRVTHNGTLIPTNVKEGDIVLVPDYGGTPLKFDGEDYHIYRDDDLIGVVRA